MAVTLRFKRIGRRNRACFRLNAVDSRAKRDGRVIEELGHYDPLVRKADMGLVLNRERIEYWLSKGAQTSATVTSILKKQGIKKPAATG
jgi:small subunit ribosomal protein S16